MKLSVGIVAREFTSIGGLQSYTESILDELHRQGHSTVVLSSREPPKQLKKKGIQFVVCRDMKKSEKKISKLVNQNSLCGREVLLEKNRVSEKVRKFVEMVRHNKGKPVILYINLHRAYFLPVTLNVIEECNKHRIPLIGRQGSFLNFFKYEPLEENILKCANALVSPSILMKNDLIEHGADGKNIWVVHNGIENKFFLAPRKKKNRKISILYPGRITGRYRGITWSKGIGDLIFALSKVKKEHPDFELVIGGNDPADETFSTMRRLFCQLSNFCGVEDKIRFLSQEESERTRFIRQFFKADIVICCSQYRESYCSAAWEAMACQKPVIATERVSSLLEAVPCHAISSVDQITPRLPFVLTPLCAPDTLARTILELIQKPALRRSIGKNGQKLALKRKIAMTTRSFVRVISRQAWHSTVPQLDEVWDHLFNCVKEYPTESKTEKAKNKSKLGILKLSKREKARIEIERKKRQKRSYRRENRTFEEVSAKHGEDFIIMLKNLKKRFSDERLWVLDEGAGRSTFIPELIQRASIEIEPFLVRGIKTDIQPRDQETVNSTPEELAEKFGSDRFHLIVSTWGGLSRTPFKKIKGLANVAEILKKGGMATIVFDKDQRYYSKLIRAASELKKYYPKLRYNITEHKKKENGQRKKEPAEYILKLFK